MKINYLRLLAALTALGTVASTAVALPVNVTIADKAPGDGFGGGPFGVGLEDNETEPGTVHSQDWDMEAYVLDATTMTLSIVGGYDMINGFQGFAPGDLFIKIGGGSPDDDPTAPNSGNEPNSTYGYSYVVDLTSPAGYNVLSLSGSSLLQTVEYDYLLSNPWRYLSGGTDYVNTAISYTPNASAGQLAAIGAAGLQGGAHNILTVDLSFIVGQVAPGESVWLSYTMECGNDSLKGRIAPGGFTQVPDSGASVLLIGLGLGALSAFGLKRRRA